jgi:hypothetical protein
MALETLPLSIDFLAQVDVDAPAAAAATSRQLAAGVLKAALRTMGTATAGWSAGRFSSGKARTTWTVPSAGNGSP